MEYFCDVENREAKEIAPGIQIRTFWGAEILVSVVDLAANSVVPMHSHPHEQAGVVISGELELTIGGETHKLGPEDTYIIPGDVEHSAKVGDVPTKVWDVFSPVREDYQY
jgi:quercetin dioxygenase-like cupin family protein